MLEVLLSLGHLIRVGELGGQMDAGSKMRLIVEQALLEIVDWLLELFFPLLNAPELELSNNVQLGVQLLALYAILVVNNSFILVTFLLIDPS